MSLRDLQRSVRAHTEGNWKAAGAAAKKVPAVPTKYVKVADMDNDG